MGSYETVGYIKGLSGMENMKLFGSSKSLQEIGRWI